MREVAEACAERGVLAANMVRLVNEIGKMTGQADAIAEYLEGMSPVEGMPDWMAQPIRNVWPRLAMVANAGNADAGEVVTVEAYVLARAIVVLADPDIPGGQMAAVLWAAKADVPLWLVSSKVATPPWIHTHADLVVRPEFAADLIKAVLG